MGTDRAAPTERLPNDRARVVAASGAHGVPAATKDDLRRAPDDRRSRAVLVIIPAYNEEVALGPTLQALRATVPHLDVVVVDDGSVDRTADVARRAGVPLLRLPFNLGIGGALRTGFRYAVSHGYDAAVQFDADGQHDPASVERLLEALDGEVDLVIGNRFADVDEVPHRPYDVGRVRSGAMGMLRVLNAQLSGQHVTDTSSGFRAFSRPMLEYFAAEYPVEYMESVEALLLASTRGFTVLEVPVVMHERSGGRASQHRLKLLYHFCRLLLVLGATTPRARRRTPLAAVDAAASAPGSRPVPR